MSSPDLIPDAMQTEPTQLQMRYFKFRSLFQSLRKRRARLFLAFLFFATVFAVATTVQHHFVHTQLYGTTARELSSWAVQIANEIAYKDHWDLQGYRRASLDVPSWNIVTKDGLIIDVEGFIPGLLGQVEPLDESILNGPKTVVTSVGETWRLFARKVAGGSVIVGICSPDNTADADSRLLANAARFGPTLEQAAMIGSREIDFIVDYAVVSSKGELKAASGGVPLRIDTNGLPNPSDHLAPFNTNGKPYLLYFKGILDAQSQRVGTIIVPKDMALANQALQTQDRFNIGVVAIAALLAGAIALWLVAREFLGHSRQVTVTLGEALRTGEGSTIEFKSTFHWDLRQSKQIDERRLDVLKSIAGFLNARGGTLFIGVTEDTTPPTVRGLGEDLKLVKGSKDQLQRALRDLITTRIGPQFSPFISDTLAETSGQLYWAVAVQESLEPVFVRWKAVGESKEQKKFYVREGPKTSDLDNESTWHYIKNRWG
jgi:Putative DNA-binding domain